MKQRALRPSSFRVLIGALVALVVAGLLALGMSAPAFASTFTLTVKLTDKAGTALTHYDVWPIALNDSTGEEAFLDDPDPATAVSGKPGYYQIADLDSSTHYTLQFAPDGTTATDGMVQYLGGSGTVAGALLVPSGSSFVSASLATGGTLTGKVTSPTGAAVKDADVEIYEYDGSNWVDQNYELTNSSGVWTLPNVEPGSYKFHFYTPNAKYSQIWSGGATSEATATATYVSPGAKVTVNQKFAAGTGSIAGTLRYGLGGDTSDYKWSHWTPVAIPISGSTLDRSRQIVGAASSSSGAWSVGSLEPGNYVIEFLPYYLGQQDEYLVAPSGPTSSSVSSTASAATQFTVTAGHKTTAATGTVIDGQADGDGNGLLGGLSVTVENNNGSAKVSGALVDVVRDADGLEYVSGTSNSNGFAPLSYSDGTAVSTDGEVNDGPGLLYPGNYTILVVDPTGANEPYNASVAIGYGANNLTIKLPTLIHAPGFSTLPTLSSSTARVGTHYVASGAVVYRTTDPTTKISYQWLRNGAPIYGATTATYDSTGGDYGRHLAVRATVSSFGFADVSTTVDVGGSNASTQALGAAPVNIAAPSMIIPGGSIVDGSTLTATPGTWTVAGMDPTALHFDYTWSYGSHGSTFSPSDQNIQDKNNISVSVVASAPGYGASTSVSSSAAQPQFIDGITLSKAPTITSKTVAGVKTYSVSTGTWKPSGTTYTYSWQYDGGQEASTPTFVPADHDLTVPDAYPISVIVTAAKLGYNPVGTTVLLSAGNNFPAQTTDPTVKDLTSGVTATRGGTTPFKLGDKLSVTDQGDWTYVGHADTPTKVTYAWFRDGVAISKATSTSYTMTVADVSAGGTNIQLRQIATFKDGSVFVGEPGTFGIGTLTALPTPTPLVTITGVPTDGQKLTASVASWGVTGVTDTYQWYDCIWPACDDPENAGEYTLVAGATKSTYTSASTDAGAYVVVDGTKPGYVQGESNSEFTKLYAADDLEPVTDVGIAGVAPGEDVHVGVKLTVAPPIWSQSGTKTTYEWQALGTSGWATVGTGTTYTPTAADMDGVDLLSIVAVGTHDWMVSEPDYSADYTVDYGTLHATKPPVVTKTSTGYSVSAGTYSATSATSTTFYDWEADGTAVGGGDGPTIPNLSAPAGTYVYVTVRQRVPGYDDLSTTLTAQKGTLKAAAETITGTNGLGNTLSVSDVNPFSSTYGTTQGTITPTYQWYANGAAISGTAAKQATYTPTSSSVGKTISVKVTGSSPNYTSLTVTATESSTFGGGTFGGGYSPTISPASPAPGTAVHLEFAAFPVTPTLKYKWQVRPAGGSWTTVGTSSTFTPTAAEVTDALQAIVTVSAAGYGTQTWTSYTTTVAYAPTLATLSPPTLTQSPEVGGTIVVNPGIWNTPTLTYAYTWWRNGTQIPGVTGTSWTATDNSVGDAITVQVTASRTGYAPVTVSSESVTVTLGDAPVATVAPKITGSGQTYSVSLGTWSTTGLTFTYRWIIRNGDTWADAPGAGANTSTYTRSGPDAGTLAVLITATRPGYNPVVNLEIDGPTLTAAP